MYAFGAKSGCSSERVAMKSLRGGGVLKFRTSAKSVASSFSWFILNPNTSPGTLVRTNFSSNRTEGRRYPRAASASRRAATASSPAADTSALFESGRATAWWKSTASIADAAGGKAKTDAWRNRTATDRAEREENRAGRAILASFAQRFIAYSCNISFLHDETAHCVPFHEI